MKQFIVIALIVLCRLDSTFAQKFDLGTWNILNLKYSLNDKWSFFGEAQIRSLKFYHNFHYYEYKAGVNYKVHKNVKLSLGAGSYQTYKEGGDFVLPKENNEFRLWPQVILFLSIGKVKIEQRYRAEFRFTTRGYRNRFRYRIGLSYSLGKEKNGYKPFQISFSNEIFLTNIEPYFERNRMLLAFNYKPAKVITIQIGYLHQFDYKITDETGSDFLQIGCFIELFRKKSPTKTVDIDTKDN